MISLWKDAGNGVRVARLTEPQEAEALVCLFEGVAERENWQPDGALRRWQKRSVYFALEAQEHLAGGLQLVLPEEEETLPCYDLWPEVSAGPSRYAAHIAILALDEAVRGQSLLFWRLAVEMWRYCVGEGIATLFIEVTPRVLPIYQRLGWPLKIEGELRHHWGEDCYLCTLGIPEVAQTLLERAEHSAYYREIVAQAFRVDLPKQAGREVQKREETLQAEALC